MITLQVPRAHALKKGDTPRLSVVRWPDKMTPIRARSTQHPLELRCRHHVCQTLVVVFQPIIWVVPLIAWRHYHRSNLELKLLSLLVKIYCLGVTDSLARSAILSLKINTMLPVNRRCVRNSLRKRHVHHGTRPKPHIELRRQRSNSSGAEILRVYRTGRADERAGTTAHANLRLSIEGRNYLTLNAAVGKAYDRLAHAFTAHSHAKAAKNALLVPLLDSCLGYTPFGRYELDILRLRAPRQQQFQNHLAGFDDPFGVGKHLKPFLNRINTGGLDSPEPPIVQLDQAQTAAAIWTQGFMIAEGRNLDAKGLGGL